MDSRLIVGCFTWQCDLLDIPAVAQLEKDAKYALVYQLLKIFLTQRLDAYLDFQAANSTLLKSYGNYMFCYLSLGLLDASIPMCAGCMQFIFTDLAFSDIVGLVHEDCIAKMRLMSLVDLGSAESGRIPYSVIKDVLRVKSFM